MDPEVQHKLETLLSDYQEVTGKPFSHFYCPILFRDQDAELCRAHIVNSAFPDSCRKWTVQRADVDSFYGSAFESDFVDIQYKSKHLTEDAIIDQLLSKKLRPKVYIGEKKVEHFIAGGPVPAHFTEVHMKGPDGPVRFGLKIRPDETLSTAKWSIAIEKDVRLAALVSILKAAHLTLFEMLGYRYALSAGGHLLGHDILGEFFLNNKGRSKVEIIANGLSHFREFANMMRPILNPPPDLKGTAADHFVFVCRCDSDAPWGLTCLSKHPIWCTACWFQS
jgi:hypothetical protein